MRRAPEFIKIFHKKSDLSVKKHPNTFQEPMKKLAIKRLMAVPVNTAAYKMIIRGLIARLLSF